MHLNRLKFAALAVSLCATAAQAQPEAVGEVELTDTLISISGSGHQRKIACDGRKLEVVGSDHVVTATGVCGTVEVFGVNNQVSVEVKPKGKLEIAGTDHTVRWKSEGKISQSVSGTGHKVTRVK